MYQVTPIKYRFTVRAWFIAIGSVVILALIVAYVVFQARFLIMGPQIVLAFEPAVANQERVIELSGSAYNITHLWLNDRPIYTDETGNFKEALVLENGYTITTLKARDRYGRETRVVRSFVFAPTPVISQSK